MVKPVSIGELRFEAPPSAWSTLVAAVAVAAAGGGKVEHVDEVSARLALSLLTRLDYNVEVRGGELRLEPPSGVGGSYTLSVGCSRDYAVFAGVVAGALARPGARVVLRGCEELVKVDWRPLVESVAVYGGRAWVTGNPRSLAIIEAVGRGRLRPGLWRVRADPETSAHIAALVAIALASPSRTHILVWPRDPLGKTDIDHAVYAAGALGGVEYSPIYNKFSVEPGSPGSLSSRPDFALALHLAGLAASGVKVEIVAWSTGDTPYEPTRIAAMLLERLGYSHEVNDGVMVVKELGAQVTSRVNLYDYPEYAPTLLTLAAARRGELKLEDVPDSYRGDVDDVVGLLAGLGYSVETAPEHIRLRAGGEPPLEEIVATCTTPHVLLAAVPLAPVTRTRILVERAECLRSVWPRLYPVLEEAGLVERV